MVVIPWSAFSSTETASLLRVQDLKTWRNNTDAYLTSVIEANRNKLLEEPSEEERYQWRLVLRCAHGQKMSSHHYEPRKWWGHSTAWKHENPVARLLLTRSALTLARNSYELIHLQTKWIEYGNTCLLPIHTKQWSTSLNVIPDHSGAGLAILTQ